MSYHAWFIHIVAIESRLAFRERPKLTVILLKAGETFDFESLPPEFSDTELATALGTAEAGFKGYARQRIPTDDLTEGLDEENNIGFVGCNLSFAYNSGGSGTSSETIDRIIFLRENIDATPPTSFNPIFQLILDETITFAADGNALTREFRFLDFNATVP